jgi:predicted Ser/Thr protein kinase
MAVARRHRQERDLRPRAHTSVNPFDLPDDVIDAATARLSEASPAEREVALLELAARFPAHAGELRRFVGAVGVANRMLAVTFPQAVAELPQFDGYRLIRRLGEGAFGVVYLCEQAAPIQREVAIKLLRPGAGDRNTLLRFEAERRFLARLQHPAIAQIFGAGALPDGRPWFVMEFVDGATLLAFCDRERLGIDARLRLFVRVCHAVQHAHEQGIVHRDLKPSNVLVVMLDGEAQPKVIDFGIARALQMPVDDGTPRTETGRIVGTPGYMSPEQAEGRLDEVDERSDVWSLGAMLFELLTGTLPLGARPTATDSDPVWPSRRLSAEPGRFDEVARQRNTDARRLTAGVRGNLDWIVAKAVTRDRERRYANVLELSADLLRHLRGESVLAGPPALGYRLRKFVRRHRTGIVVSAAVGLAALLGVETLVELQARVDRSLGQAQAAASALLARANDANLVKVDALEVRRALAEDALAFYARCNDESPGDVDARVGRARCLLMLSGVHWLLGNSVRSERLAHEVAALLQTALTEVPDRVDVQAVAGAAALHEARAHAHVNYPAKSPLVECAVRLLERAHAQQPAGVVEPLVQALTALAGQSPLAVAEAALERAESLQRGVCAARPDDADAWRRLGRVLVARTELRLAADDLVAAEERLASARQAAERSGGDFELGCEIAAAGADLVGRRDGNQAAMERRELVWAEARRWLAAEPYHLRAHRFASASVVRLAELQREQNLPCVPTYRAALAVAEEWHLRFPNDALARQGYALAVERLFRPAAITGRRSELAPLEPFARRATELLAPAPDLPEPLRLRLAWAAHGTLGFVADALDLPDAADIWSRCAAELEKRFRTELPANEAGAAASCANRVVRQLLIANHTDAAAVWLARLQGWYRMHPQLREMAISASETAGYRTLAALQKDDIAAAIREAEGARGTHEGWRGIAVAAESMSLVQARARELGAGDASETRDRAVELCDAAVAVLEPMVDARPDYVWGVEALLRLRIRRAVLGADRGDPIDGAALQRATAEYAALEPNVHAYQWQAAVLAAGRQVLAR